MSCYFSWTVIFLWLTHLCVQTRYHIWEAKALYIGLISVNSDWQTSMCWHTVQWCAFHNFTVSRVGDRWKRQHYHNISICVSNHNQTSAHRRPSPSRHRGALDRTARHRHADGLPVDGPHARHLHLLAPVWAQQLPQHPGRLCHHLGAGEHTPEPPQSGPWSSDFM